MKDTPILKLLGKLAPPVMLALLIQSIYNIVDSFFIARYNLQGLTALSIIFPIQFLMVALATGTGVGINILVSRYDGAGEKDKQANIIKSGLWLGLFNYALFTIVGLLLLTSYFHMSSSQELVIKFGCTYGKIIFIFSLGMFVEANCTKILQARGNMKTPMLAQVVGAAVNIALDPVLIFGLGPVPKMGIRGAAIATIIGQWIAMIIVGIAIIKKENLTGKFSLKSCKQIYFTGMPSIILQSLYTFYVVGLNLILKTFTEDAVTVLGIYYKLQTFFFIPLTGLQQVILPIISYNYGAAQPKRVKQTLQYSTIISFVVMLVACLSFVLWPRELIRIFSSSPSIIHIGIHALRIISISFPFASVVMMYSVYFQGISCGKQSIFLTILRQVILLVPLAWVLHFWGLEAVWYTYPITEVVTAAFCIIFYRLYRYER